MESNAVLAEDLRESFNKLSEQDDLLLSGTDEDLTLNNDPRYPCPFGWTVRPNPSVDNSLSYIDDDSTIAISVTSLANTRGSFASPETYARVASLEMNCSLPDKSNLIEDGWTFTCKQENVEAIVYGKPDDLALLVISGRNADTEAKLEEFIKFLASQTD